MMNDIVWKRTDVFPGKKKARLPLTERDGHPLRCLAGNGIVSSFAVLLLLTPGFFHVRGRYFSILIVYQRPAVNRQIPVFNSHESIERRGENDRFSDFCH
jgi:hypothetical protein